jgi:hypothetical protein
VILAALLALGAVPDAAEAEQLAAKKQWDELYLAWAKVKPDAVPQGDRKRVAKALGKGCGALLASDAVMAQSLGEKAVSLEPEADALLCAAKAALKSEQRGEAEELLRKGRSGFGADDRFPLELGRLLLSENDAPQAARELSRIGRKSKQYREASALLAKADALNSQSARARDDLKATEKSVHKRELEAAEDPAPLPSGEGRDERRPAATGGSSSYQSGVDGEGRRTRANAHFRFRYFNAQRDFGQRADYEGRVQAALEEARTSSQRLLGAARESPTEVILYSKEEFSLHHGDEMAAAVAGFYSNNAIRMNDSAEINARNQVTLVHEYVHAVMDELVHFHGERLPVWMHEGTATWVEWRYQGFDGPPPLIAKQLRGAASANRLPGIKDMTKTPLVNQEGAGLRYNASGAAVSLLLKDGGTQNLLGLLEDVGGGQAFEGAFEKRYGKTLGEFEEKLAEELKSR